ncbi:MAG: TA system VapC family ribonuclease toxin [Bryobacteraceae bacterium]
MPTLKTFLPDVNVWLALASRRHVHASICSSWINSIQSGVAAFCRVTQMGLLRLLTSEAVMGSDVLSSSDAWRVYRKIREDERIQFAPEPFALETEWKKLTALDHPTPKIWTDAYLAAFARAGEMQLVTLDRAVLSLAREALWLK